MFDPFRVRIIFLRGSQGGGQGPYPGLLSLSPSGTCGTPELFYVRIGFMMTITKDIPITIDSEILSGAPVFRGTRVPVSAFLENLEAGVSLDEFLENFPTVTRDQAVRILQHFRLSLDALSLAA